MMMQVSRTRVPEQWLSCTLKSGTVPQSEDTIKLKHSRISSQTINQDFYKELFSWCSAMEVVTSKEPTSKPKTDHSPAAYIAHAPLPPSYADSELQEAPKAMSKDWDCAAFLDPTTMAIGFDMSCLEGLDDLVVYSPSKAFSELCWGNAVCVATPADNKFDSLYENSPFPVPAPTPRASRQSFSQSPLAACSSDSDTDSDECQTDQDDDLYDPPIMESQSVNAFIVGGLSSYNLSDGREQYFNVDDGMSFMSFEPHFPTSIPKNSIGDFPRASHSRQASIPNRIATFCVNIPSKVSFGRSTAF